MFGISISELILIAIVAFVFIGPKQLPEVMRQMGKFFVHLRRMSFEFKETFDSVIQDAERQLEIEKFTQMKDATPVFENKPASEPPSSSVRRQDDASEGASTLPIEGQS